MRRLVVLGAFAAAVVAAASCGLNPQPEPPSETMAAPGTGGSTNGAGGSTDGAGGSTSGAGGGWSGSAGTGGGFAMVEAGSADAMVPSTADGDAARDGDADVGDAGLVDGADGAADAGGG
jgi:hypothetical protein